MARLVALVCMSLAAAAIGSERAANLAAGARGAQAEVVVSLSSPSLAYAPQGRARLDAEQRAFRTALAARLPSAEIHWRYRLVANGFAVSLPSAQIDDLRRIPGVRDVYESAPYQPQLDRSPGQIGAPALWGQGLETAGQGMKIGIIDTGVDASHPFFDPAGYTMPPGFP
jgi:subtilisin family serine protease